MPGELDTRPAPAAGQPVVDLRGISKTYEPTSRLLNLFVRSAITSPVHALRTIDLDVHRGQIKAIVGPNGAGKTTLFRIIVGLTTPTTGSSTVMGLDSVSEAEEARRHLGFMPSDDRSLFMRLTCAENLRFHGRIHGLKGKPLDRAVHDSLEAVGIGHRHDSAVFSLSSGMRARVQLARAILHRPAVLVLDEPTATIDPVASHELLGLLVNIVDELQIGALMSSHRLEEIEALSTNVVLLDRGQVRFDGDLEVLRSQLDRPRIELQFDDAPAAERAVERLAHRLADQIKVFRPIPTIVECETGGTLKTGDVLQALDDLLPSLRHCRELPVPLRDLLADIYASPEEVAP